MIQHLQYGMNRAGLRVIRAIYEALKSRMHHRTGAHRARLNCNKQFAASKAMVTNGSTCLTQRNDLSVRRGIAVRNIAIPALPYDSPLENHHGSHRHFIGFEGTLRTPQSLQHPGLVRLSIGNQVLGCSCSIASHDSSQGQECGTSSILSVLWRGEEGRIRSRHTEPA